MKPSSARTGLWACRHCASLSRQTRRFPLLSSRKQSTSATESNTVPPPSNYPPPSEGAYISGEPKAIPRWRQTPERMINRGPHPLGKRVAPYHCNEDPMVLDRFYNALLQNPEHVAAISEEVRWVAVTDKSFDHGRRGFNERLAFLGRQIVHLQATLGRLNSAPPPASVSPTMERDHNQAEAIGSADLQGRPPPFEHPDYAGLESLLVASSDGVETATHLRLARAARGLGINRVVRWRPRDLHDLAKSGENAIVLSATLGVIGAVSLSCGGAVAAALTRRLLQ